MNVAIDDEKNKIPTHFVAAPSSFDTVQAELEELRRLVREHISAMECIPGWKPFSVVETIYALREALKKP
jgi:hypothetical protein